MISNWLIEQMARFSTLVSSIVLGLKEFVPVVQAR